MFRGSRILMAPFLAVALLVGTNEPKEEPETPEETIDRHATYLDNKGCDGDKLRHGEVPYCPDNE